MDDGDRTQSVTFMLAVDDMEYFNALAKKRGLNRSDLIREACKEYRETRDHKICGKCREVNPSGSKYCCSCGEPLTEEKNEVLSAFEELKRKHPEEFIEALKKSLDNNTL